MPIEFYSPVSGGAIATVIMQIGREFLTAGHRVSVLTTIDRNPAYTIGTVIRIEHRIATELRTAPRFFSRILGKLNGYDWPCFNYYLRSFLNALKRLQPPPDVIIIFNDLASSEYVKRVMPGAKVIVWLHNECRTRHNICRTIAATDMFVANSGYIRDWTVSKLGIPLHGFVVAHNGVDLKAFRPHEEYLNQNDLLRVLFLGRIDPNKGPDIVADAVAVLRREGLPLTLTVVGGLWFYGDVDPMTDSYFRSLKVKMEFAEARYLGHVDRHAVPEVLRQHDVVCVLSRTNEPFGLVVLEAMASGCAVIASKRGGLPEACGGAAILVDESDFPAVCDTLRSLVLDRNLLNDYKRQSIARAARQPWSECANILKSAVSAL